MEYTEKQRQYLKTSAAVEAGDARIDAPSMARSSPDDMDAYHIALERATRDEEYPEWADKMGLVSYDAERHNQDIAQAEKNRESISNIEKGTHADYEEPVDGEMPVQMKDRIAFAEISGSRGDALPDYAADNESRDYLRTYKDRVIEEQAGNREREIDLEERYESTLNMPAHKRGDLFKQKNAIRSQDALYAASLDSAEHRFQMGHAKEAEGKREYTGNIVAIKDNHAYQEMHPVNGGGYVKHDLEKLTVSKDLGAIKENDKVTINYPTSGGTGIAKQPEVEASRDTHQHQANKSADFDRDTPF